MTCECDIRFLIDYLNGDLYFKIYKKYHRLNRVRDHFKLVADIESKFGEMQRNL